MARADGTDDDARRGAGPHADVSDARLTELLRGDTGTAYPALRELRARHRPSLLAYARLCTAGESSARQLSAHTFARAAREIARGTGAGTPLRHRLLLLAGEQARDWATDDRSTGLDPGLLLALHTGGALGPVPPLRTAFRNLPTRARGLVWYGVVERESAERTAVLLGVNREDVERGIPTALHTLARSCLRSRLAASPDPRCADLQLLIEESVQPDGFLRSTDLHGHLARCPHCTAGYEEQRALRERPRTTLAEGLLPWAGTAYVRGTEPVPPGPPAVRAANEAWPPARRFALASAALGVALAPLLLFLLGGGAADQEPVGSGSGAPGSPPASITASATPSSSVPPSISATAKPPSPSPASPSPSPSRTYPVTPPGGVYAQVVNVTTGLCLDIRDGRVEEGADVVTAPCSSSRTQRWRVDSERGVVRSYAGSGHCLDSRGSVERGVGVRGCDAVDGRQGWNLRFAVDTSGRIRPAIDFGTAVTPADGHDVVLRPLDGGAGQRWRAGAR